MTDLFLHHDPYRKPKFQKGERVVTKFGSGFVVDIRPQEKIYEINLRRLRFRGFFHESSVEAFPYERVTHLVVDGRTIPAPEMPKNTPEFKRRAVINEAIKAAREGKIFDTPDTDAEASGSLVEESESELAEAKESPIAESAAGAKSEENPPAPVSGSGASPIAEEKSL